MSQEHSKEERSNDRTGLTSVVEALCNDKHNTSRIGLVRGGNRKRLTLPNRELIIDMVESLRSVLFPTFFSDWDLSHESLHFYVGATLDKVLHTLQEQVKRALCFAGDKDPRLRHDCDERAATITSAFLAKLPGLRELLISDVEAAFEGDPAVLHAEEIIVCYPGLRAITDFRLAHELYLLDVPLVPRIITEFAHGLTGIDIHPGATIGRHFFIDHGTGIVIGETCRIGDSVRIYQGVTLGAKSFPLDEDGNPIKGIARHPIVEDNVIIYSGATILGRITIGNGSVIGGNVWLTKSVPANSQVAQTQAKQMIFEEGGGI
ncbi:MAG: serine acetyltransferase [Deltaproteobacteria bacterium CG2_30_63_29]|nr:MAG: serine acetyltransferase [Deltaproteobacteria bacterium CG2_30_63_29]